MSNAAFKDGTYRITLRVTNFLGRTATDTLVFRKQAVGTVPMVDLQAPNNFVLSDGLSVTAAVKASSVCGTKPVQFTFRLGVADASAAAPAPLATQTKGDAYFSQARRLGGITQRFETSLRCPRLPPASSDCSSGLSFSSQAQLWAAGLRAGAQANVSVTVAFTDTPRVTYSAFALVDVLGDPLVASLAGSPQGLLPATGTLRFTAARSADPSDPANSEAMRFAWACVRPDAPLLSCFTDRGYQGNRNGSTWEIDAARLLPGVTSTVQVCVPFAYWFCICSGTSAARGPEPTASGRVRCVRLASTERREGSAASQIWHEHRPAAGHGEQGVRRQAAHRRSQGQRRRAVGGGGAAQPAAGGGAAVCRGGRRAVRHQPADGPAQRVRVGGHVVRAAGAFGRRQLHPGAMRVGDSSFGSLN